MILHNGSEHERVICTSLCTITHNTDILTFITESLLSLSTSATADGGMRCHVYVYHITYAASGIAAIVAKCIAHYHIPSCRYVTSCATPSHDSSRHHDDASIKAKSNDVIIMVRALTCVYLFRVTCIATNMMHNATNSMHVTQFHTIYTRHEDIHETNRAYHDHSSAHSVTDSSIASTRIHDGTITSSLITMSSLSCHVIIAQAGVLTCVIWYYSFIILVVDDDV